MESYDMITHYDTFVGEISTWHEVKFNQAA